MLIDQRNGLRQSHRVVNEFRVGAAAFRLCRLKNLNEFGGKSLVFFGTDCVKRFGKRVFRLCFGGKSVEHFGKSDDLGNRAYFRTFKS